MATGAMGGNPITTKRDFVFASTLTNYIFYGCPPNTISYVSFHSIASTNVAGGQLNEMGLSLGNGVGAEYKNFITTSPTYGPTGATLIGTNGAFPLSLYGRIDNPFVVGGLVYGQLILYPGDNLYITAQVFAGTSHVAYSTLEVVAGS